MNDTNETARPEDVCSHGALKEHCATCLRTARDKALEKQGKLQQEASLWFDWADLLLGTDKTQPNVTITNDELRRRLTKSMAATASDLHDWVGWAHALLGSEGPPQLPALSDYLRKQIERRFSANLRDEYIDEVEAKKKPPTVNELQILDSPDTTKHSGTIKQNDKFFLVEIPEIDGMTQGHTYKEALAMAKDYVECFIGGTVSVTALDEGHFEFECSNEHAYQLLVKKRGTIETPCAGQCGGTDALSIAESLLKQAPPIPICIEGHPLTPQGACLMCEECGRDSMFKLEEVGTRNLWDEYKKLVADSNDS